MNYSPSIFDEIIRSHLQTNHNARHIENGLINIHSYQTNHTNIYSNIALYQGELQQLLASEPEDRCLF